MIMKSKKNFIASLALAGILAFAAVAPCGIEAKGITDLILSNVKLIEAKDGLITLIPFETVDSKVSYSGRQYVKTYDKGNYTYFEVHYSCTCGGYEAKIDSVYELNGSIHVATSLKGDDSAFHTDVMTYPYVIGRIAKTSKNLVFDAGLKNLLDFEDTI